MDTADNPGDRIIITDDNHEPGQTENFPTADPNAAQPAQPAQQYEVVTGVYSSGYESDLSSAPSNPIDPDAPPVQPRKRAQPRPTTRQIEDELHLTSQHGKRLHDLIQSELKKAGLLGKINFSSRMAEDEKNTLQQIYATAKQKLGFLEAAGVGEARLDQLLYQRTLIINSNERHNKYMVKTGRVKRRLGEAASGEQQQPELPSQEMMSSLSALIPTEQEEEQSVMAPVLIQAREVGDAAATTKVREGEHATPSSPMHNEDQTASRGASPGHDEVLLTSFIVRVKDSTAGAAIHASQLVSSSQQDKPVTINELSLETFLGLASEQVHFDVTGCISAVVPNTCIFSGTKSTKIALVSEETWKAVLQAWQSARCKTCELIVERADVN